MTMAGPALVSFLLLCINAHAQARSGLDPWWLALPNNVTTATMYRVSTITSAVFSNICSNVVVRV